MVAHPVIKHKKTSVVPDTGDINRVQPSDFNAEHDVDLGAALMALFALVPAADRLPYFTDAGTAALAPLTSAARALLAGASMPAIVAALGAIAKAGDVMTGALTLAGDPAIALHAATKQYVDNSIAGLDPKAGAKYATVAALPANGYLAGVITATGNGALAVDGFAPASGDRLLVKNEAAAANNGIYVVTAPGDATSPYVLTRAADMAAWNQVPGANLIVDQGATLAGTGWLCTAAQAGAIGVNAINWAEWFGTGVYQPNNANLTALAGLVGAANKVPYFNGVNAMALLALGSAANNLVQLDGAAKLPAVDGSQLTNLPITIVTDGYINKLRNASLASWFHGATVNVGTGGGWGAEGIYLVPAGAGVVASRVANGLANPRTVHAMQITGATGCTDVVARFVVESYDAAPLAGKQVTFQIPVLNNTGGTITPTITVKHATAQDAGYTVVDVAGANLQSIANGATGILAYSWTAPAGTINGLSINIDFGSNLSSNTKSLQIGGGFDLRATPGVSSGAVGTPLDPQIRNPSADHEWNRRFFEASYDNGTAPGSVTNNGVSGVDIRQSSGTFTLSASVVPFKAGKRIAPVITGYSPNSGAAAKAFDGSASVDVAFVSQWVGLNQFAGNVTPSSPTANMQSIFHWTADAALVGA